MSALFLSMNENVLNRINLQHPDLHHWGTVQSNTSLCFALNREVFWHKKSGSRCDFQNTLKLSQNLSFCLFVCVCVCISETDTLWRDNTWPGNAALLLLLLLNMIWHEVKDCQMERTINTLSCANTSMCDGSAKGRRSAWRTLAQTILQLATLRGYFFYFSTAWKKYANYLLSINILNGRVFLVCESETWLPFGESKVHRFQLTASRRGGDCFKLIFIQKLLFSFCQKTQLTTVIRKQDAGAVSTGNASGKTSY